MKTFVLIIVILIIVMNSHAQYSNDCVNYNMDFYNGSTISVLNICRKNESIKVKYFTAKEGKTTVYQRFLSWKAGKNIISYTSGTYMDNCDASISKPVGLCIDNGNIVNNSLKQDLDGLVIVTESASLVVSNLKDKDLTIWYQNGARRTIDIRDQFSRSSFVSWAISMNATVFQNH